MDSLEILEDHRPELEAICQEFRVKRLCTYGETAKGGWDLWTADFQFVVEFDNASPTIDTQDPYFEFRNRLADILKSTVDLYDRREIKSRFLLRMVDRSSRGWYQF